MLYFAFRRPTTSSFCCILRFVARRRAVFAVFCVSSADARQFLSFSAFRRSTTGGFRGIFVFPRGWKRRKWVNLTFQGVGNAEIECFCLSKGLEAQKLGDFVFPRGWKRGFFRFSIKNCDFFAPNGYFYQKIAIFPLPTANSIKKLQFICSRRLILSKKCGFSPPDGCFCRLSSLAAEKRALKAER